MLINDILTCIKGMETDLLNEAPRTKQFTHNTENINSHISKVASDLVFSSLEKLKENSSHCCQWDAAILTTFWNH